MKNNQLSAVEKLDVSMQSHKFYHEQCVEIETKINDKIDTIFQTEEAGQEPLKEDIKETLRLVNQLLNLSNKYLDEGQNVVHNLSNLDESETEDIEKFIHGMKESIIDVNGKQQGIHERVQEIKEMLSEMYDIKSDEDTF